MRTLEGLTALVTGGGDEIGRAIALALAARGVRIVVTGRDEKALGETVGEIAHGGGKARHLAGDLRDPVHLAAAVERAHAVFGGLEIVVAAACHVGFHAVGSREGERDLGQAILQTELMGAFYTFNAALPRMAGPGRLLTMRRMASPSGAPGHAASSASAGGMRGLSRALAVELAAKRITCNGVVAGAVEPEEVAALAVFLCSGAADGITGQDIAIGAAS